MRECKESSSVMSGGVAAGGKLKKRSSSSKSMFKKSAWSATEDMLLMNYISRYGIWNWSQIPKYAGLSSRSGKSCRLRWVNYLNPDVRRGNYTHQEDTLIITMRRTMRAGWSTIAASLPGRTDNEIKNRWHTHLKKRIIDDVDDDNSILLLQQNDENKNNINVELTSSDSDHSTLLLSTPPSSATCNYNDSSSSDFSAPDQLTTIISDQLAAANSSNSDAFWEDTISSYTSDITTSPPDSLIDQLTGNNVEKTRIVMNNVDSFGTASTSGSDPYISFWREPFLLEKNDVLDVQNGNNWEQQLAMPTHPYFFKEPCYWCNNCEYCFRLLTINAAPHHYYSDSANLRHGL